MLYSTSNGVARSINLEDVIRILGYTGPQGGYLDNNYNYVPTSEILTLEELAIYTYGGYLDFTPDGTDIYKYKTNYCKINKTDVENMTYPDRVDLVFPTINRYWLASNFMAAWNIYAKFSLYSVDVDYCGCNFHDSWEIFRSNDTSSPLACGLRPVVTLTSKIEKSSDSEGIIWEFAD